MKLVHKGFTLIELLIVVAIIAILAAIAVPNFIEAQTRAKISRVKSDLRTYATGLEAYHIDERSYPIWLDPSGGLVKWHYEASQALIPLTTPISYLSQSRFRDPFQSAGRVLEGWTEEYRDSYIWAYYRWTGNGEQAWPSRTFGDHWAGVPNLDAACVNSQGPGSWHTVPEWTLAMFVNGQIQEAWDQIYDSTNGTTSRGGIVRYVGDTRGFNPNL